MTINVDELLKAVGQLGIFVVAAGALWWSLLIPRKDHQGNRKSPLLVPGTEHDRAIDAALESENRTRKFYETQLVDIRKQTEHRVGEVRGYRDEALVANAQLLENLSNAVRDIALVLELLKLLEAATRQVGTPESKEATRERGG